MNVGYVISSNHAYFNIATPRLINSLHQSGVKAEQIHCFIGRSPNEYTEQTKDGSFHFETYGAYEHTALIGTIKRKLDRVFPYVFLLHDTCEVGKNFRALVEQQLGVDTDVVAVNGAMCGFALYRTSFLRQFYPLLVSLIDCDKHTAMVHEGFLYRSRLGSNADYPGHQYEDRGISNDPYGTGKSRLIEYYPCVDLYKYKANYGNTSQGSYIEEI